MKEILKIKISAIILFIFPILGILLSLFALNHINSFDQDILLLGKITENKKIECTSQDNILCTKYATNNDLKKKYKLTDCSLDYYKYIYIYKNKEIANYRFDDLTVLDNYKNKKYYFKAIKTNKKNNICIKYSKIYFLYKLFPKLENIFLYWKFNADVGTTEVINPFLYGEVSISNVVKRIPFNFIFKPLMYGASFFMMIYWLNYRSFFIKNNLKLNNRFVFFGVFSSIFLFLHVLFLGNNFDIPYFQKIRRLVIILFILFEILAEFFLAKKIYYNKYFLIDLMKIKIVNLKIIFVYTVIFITFASLAYMIIFDPSGRFNNILEWNYFIFLTLFYFLSAIIWKKK